MIENHSVVHTHTHTERDSFYLLAHFPKGCNDQNWAGWSKAESQESLLGLSHGCWGLHAFPCHKQAAGSEVEQLGLGTAHIWIAGEE